MSVSGSSGTRNSGISSHSHAAAASLSGPPPRTAILSPFAAPVLPVPLRCPPLLYSIVPVVLALTPRLQFLGRTTVYISAHAPSRPAAVSASKRRHEHMRSVQSSHSTAQVQQVQAKANKNERHDGPNYRKWGCVGSAPTVWSDVIFVIVATNSDVRLSVTTNTP